MRVALLQITCGFRDKAANFSAVEHALTEAVVEKKANFCVLPEVWTGVYSSSSFAEFAETIPEGDTTKQLQAWAKRFKITLVGGSISERDAEGRLFNTSVTCSPSGDIVCIHRKVHLFDIDVPNGIRFKESESLSAGDNVLSSFLVPGFGNVGVAICFDVRFAAAIELLATKKQCKLLVIPAAFNMVTGPLHWTLLARARAVDNQCFVAMCSPARDMSAS